MANFTWMLHKAALSLFHCTTNCSEIFQSTLKELLQLLTHGSDQVRWLRNHQKCQNIQNWSIKLTGRLWSWASESVIKEVSFSWGHGKKTEDAKKYNTINGFDWNTTNSFLNHCCLCESGLIQVSKCYKDGVTLILMKILREMISNEWLLS